MTHSGGKPHAVGDKGQQFEVTFFDPNTDTRKVLGWSDTMRGAAQLASCVEAHPSWDFAQIRDRTVRAPLDRAHGVT